MSFRQKVLRFWGLTETVFGRHDDIAGWPRPGIVWAPEYNVRANGLRGGGK